MTTSTTDRILYALFCLSRDTRHIDASELARACELSPTHAAGALVALERAGLVDATRARLTMAGLARAAQLAAADAGGGGPHIDLRHARPRARAALKPLAAAPATPERTTPPEPSQLKPPAGTSSATGPEPSTASESGRAEHAAAARSAAGDAR